MSNKQQVSCRVDQGVEIKVNDFKDLGGNVVNPIPGSVTWTASDPTALTLAPAVDGLSATVYPKGPVGTFNVVVECDTTLGDAIVKATQEVDITITAGLAVTLSFSTEVSDNVAADQAAAAA